ncbi:uncharacterized protein CELE_ZK856.19 [Caenorhabditis elegans]|uniref:Uncharacterized protein n=1 Tax=Caenorhabditis elegans TaxID=6239 RepID=A0A2K5ATY1_CAEEL|nr:Uncharacterized protein CELE_ZK856.19 [Caenorhabditis elegans]SPC47968.1 Uncharacterized protein CELE_ZK856.19 [Caenorhabditis elegans]|eukprot:NP_001348779.1 Uncharacterized protein CELE_ZK856.19 [Caenorhabditis elegans]
MRISRRSDTLIVYFPT